MSNLPRDIFRQTITVVRGGSADDVDEYGVPIVGAEERIHVTGCSVQPVQGVASSEATTSMRDSVTDQWRLFGPPDLVLLPDDRVQQTRDRLSPVTSDAEAHLDMQVDGESVEWLATGTKYDHVEAHLKQWKG